MSNLEKQAVYRLRGGKGKKKSTDDSVTTQTSDLSSLTAKVDKLTNSVARISQIVGKRQTRDQEEEEYDSCATIGLGHDSDEEENQSVKSASSSKSSKRRKSGNRDHKALSGHPSPARQGKI